MGFLKRTNKKFDYQPRYYKGEGNPYKIEHKFDQFRVTAGKNKNLKGKFSDAFNDLKSSDKKIKASFPVPLKVEGSRIQGKIKPDRKPCPQNK